MTSKILIKPHEAYAVSWEEKGHCAVCRGNEAGVRQVFRAVGGTVIFLCVVCAGEVAEALWQVLDGGCVGGK